MVSDDLSSQSSESLTSHSSRSLDDIVEDLDTSSPVSRHRQQGLKDFSLVPTLTEQQKMIVLTESKFNEIKRRIGAVLLNYLKQATIRIIL